MTTPPEPKATELSDSPRWVHVATIDEMQAFYLSALPRVREAARALGYAVGAHGSMRRDLDLIAVPWSESHGTRDELAEAIHVAACGFRNTSYQWEQKPNGRCAVSFPICWTEPAVFSGMLSAGHIDLSVVGDASRDAEVEALKAERDKLHAALAWLASEDGADLGASTVVYQKHCNSPVLLESFDGSPAGRAAALVRLWERCTDDR